MAFVLVRSPAVRVEEEPLGSYRIPTSDVKGTLCCLPIPGNQTAVVVEPRDFSCEEVIILIHGTNFLARSLLT